MRKPPQKRRPEPWQVSRVETPQAIRSKGQNRNMRLASTRFIWSRSNVTPAITTMIPKMRLRVLRVNLLIELASAAGSCRSFLCEYALLDEKDHHADRDQAKRRDLYKPSPDRIVPLEGEHIP